MPHLYTPENLHVTPKALEPQQSVIVLGVVRDAQDKVLVAKRIDTSVPDAVGKWEFVGGKVDFGEDPVAALVREVQEESGLMVQVKRLLPKIFTHVWTTAGGQKLQVFLLTYECSMVSGTLTNRSVADEIGELKFVSIPELQQLDALPNVLESIAYL